MIVAIAWLIGMTIFALMGAWLHTHRLGPMRVMTRGLTYLRAAGQTAKESWSSFEHTWRTQFDKHLANVKREW